jgi:diguanylate cyclase (GGDEF)-like protein
MQNRHKLILLITLILLLGFAAVSLLMFRASKQSIHEAIVINELPLIGDSIYSEIQKDLVKSVNISAMMASNTFVKNWVQNGEQDETVIKQYLQEIKQSNQAFTSFFVSDKTRKYYSASAETKKVDQEIANDAWYFRVREMQAPYELNVDRNARFDNRLTIFVNYRMLDAAKHLLGVTGVGINYDTAKNILETYEKRFQRKVYFVDSKGIIMLASDPDRPLGVDIDKLLGIKDIRFNPANLDKPIIENNKTLSYQLGEREQNVIVRYVPEMSWYLIAEKSETDAIAGITKSLYRNALLCLLITALVVALTHIALKRYHFEVESAAAIDKLTNLPNRKAFDIGMSVMMQDSQRNKTALGLLLLDLDYFKKVNDNFGHLAGDAVLKQTAETLRATIRAEDFVCRWGGEEFLVVVRDCNAAQLMLLANKIREAIQAANFNYRDKSIAVTASIGAAARMLNEEVEHLIHRADKALYQAKNTGRNQSILAK